MWARNLLVASSFDLKIAGHADIQRMVDGLKKRREKELDKKKKAEYQKMFQYLQVLQTATEKMIPQNRDAYQTSVFLSTVWAKNDRLPVAFGRDQARSGFMKGISRSLKSNQKKSFDNEIKELEKRKKKLEEEETGNVHKDNKQGNVELKKEDNKNENIAYQIQGNTQREIKDINDRIEKIKEKQKALNGKDWKQYVNYFVYLETLIEVLKKKSNGFYNAVQKEFDEGFGRFIQPRVYEIGRYGAIDLRYIKKNGESEVSPDQSIYVFSPFYPRPVDSVSSRSVTMLACSIIALCLLLFLF